MSYDPFMVYMCKKISVKFWFSGSLGGGVSKGVKRTKNGSEWQKILSV